MKFKSLLSFVIISAVSTSAFAIEIHKGKIVSHKEWTTGNNKAVFKVSKPSADMMSARDKMGKNNGGVTHYVASMAGLSVGEVGTPVSINGDHFIYVSNHSASTVRYYYTFNVCAAADEHTMNCSYYFDEIELEPEGYISTAVTPSLSVTYNQAGRFPAIFGSSLAEATSGLGSQTTSTSFGLVQVMDSSKR